MSKERIPRKGTPAREHNEWFQPIKKRTCPCGQKKTEVFAWGEYVSGKWCTVDYFCQACFADRVQARLVSHAADCGCNFKLCARSGYGPLPAWLTMASSPRASSGRQSSLDQEAIGILALFTLARGPLFGPERVFQC